MEAGKKVTELRFADLKAELTRRKLEAMGPKALLIERLEGALRKEGLDPTKYLFNCTNKKESPGDVPAVEEVKIKEEPLEEENENAYENEGGDENDAQYDENGEYDDEVDQVGDVDDECVIIEDDEEEEEEEDEEEAAAAINEEAEDEEEVENNEESTNHDNDESLHLTIEEDEQKLIHAEVADDKEKSTVSNANQKDKGTGKESITEKSLNANKDEKKNTKEDDAVKSKKKDDKTADKKETSDQKSTTAKSSQKDDKEKSTVAAGGIAATNSAKTSVGAKTTTQSRNLWVSGLSSLTRASDLKTIFSKHGKVIGAKVVTNTRTPGTRCYGYVTMATSADASRCIDHLHRTELHGRIISVERTKNEIGSSSSKTAADGGSKDAKKKEEDKKSGTSKDGTASTKGQEDKRKSEAKKDEKERPKRDDKDRENRNADNREDFRNGGTGYNRYRSNIDRPRFDTRVRDFDNRQRDREREQRREREMQERERQRLREKERQLREEDRRRREIRERQRQEEARLADERKKLALERERLESEKAELLRLERERQKLEREKIELERLELKRQQMKIMQAREEPVKRVNKRTSNERYADVSDRKRSTGNDRNFEAPPPPRFDASLVTSRSYDKKRDDFTSSATSKRIEYPKRDDYSSGTKRNAIDDYSSVPMKRTSDYISTSSKRGMDDYSASTKSSRDDYKREVEIRHIPVSTVGVNNSYHSNRDIQSSIHKPSRYGDTDRSSSNYRRGGMDEIRSAVVNKRYDNSTSGYVGNSSNTNSWVQSSTHMTHTNHTNGMSSAWQKPDDSGWRQNTTQDRYDRTYNERSSGYPSGGNTGMFGSGRPVQDRYGPAVSSRY